MAYRMPVFNIEVGIWRDGSDIADPPDVLAEANFCGGRRGYGGGFRSMATPPDFTCTAYLLIPKETDIVGDTDTVDETGDTVEIPLGSGLFYHVIHQERTALGFANEHMTAIVAKGRKTSDVGGDGDPPDGFEGILMEDDGFVLDEGGEPIQLEA